MFSAMAYWANVYYGTRDDRGFRKEYAGIQITNSFNINYINVTITESIGCVEVERKIKEIEAIGNIVVHNFQ